MTTMKPIIQVKNLNFTYPDGHKALENVSLDIAEGEIFGIIGPTGAGKSTLLQHLNGILKGDSESSIIVDSIPISKKTEKKIRQKVGLVFQNPDDQLFCPTVYEDIAFGLYNLGYHPDEVERHVSAILNHMDLLPLRNLSAHHLSFGEKKRVALATTLVMNPRVIALDEPFANLDYKSIMNVIAMITNLDLTRVIISQDILLALSICNHIALLDRGRIVMVATPGEIANDHATLAAAGLDFHPYLNLIQKFTR